MKYTSPSRRSFEYSSSDPEIAFGKLELDFCHYGRVQSATIGVSLGFDRPEELHVTVNGSRGKRKRINKIIRYETAAKFGLAADWRGPGTRTCSSFSRHFSLSFLLSK